METKELWHGDCFKIVTPILYPYEIIEEKDVVIVLPILIGNDIKYGVREELVPSYSLKNSDYDKWLTTLTGTIEEFECSDMTVLRELREESGIIPIEYKLVPIKSNIPVCKSTSMRVSVYLIFIYMYDYEEPSGDGTVFEEQSKMVWIEENDIEDYLNKDNVDFLLWSLLNIAKVRK